MSSADAPLLRVRDLAVSFEADAGRVNAVRGVSFDIPAGRTVALVGESGSGKSVISQSILGILPQNGIIEAGEIWLNDPELAPEPVELAHRADNDHIRRSVRGDRISIIFQEPMTSLSPLHTIGNQIGEALRLHRDVPENETRDRVAAMLGRVGFPEPERAIDNYPFELSGGLRQRAMIAMALICHPALLIADEPTTALDVTIQAQILQLMKELQAELGMAILFITHDLGVVANMADDIVVMFRGRIMESGPAEQLFNDPQHPYLKALLAAVPRLHTDRHKRLTPLREIESQAAELLGDIAARELSHKGEPLLEVSDLRKSFRTRKQGWFAAPTADIIAVRDVSFTVRRGETFGLVGESGSGKTTVSKLIMRALSPDRGSVVFHSHEGPIDVFNLRGQDLIRFRQRLQYMFQDPFSSLNPRMTVLDIVAEPMVIHGIGTPEERVARVKNLLEAVGLGVRHLRRYPHSFSGGQRQRIGIARALALGPELLICDEPVSALDVSVQAQILNLLNDLQRDLGLTYLFIAHNLAVVRYIADRIGVMCAGRMVEMADTDTLFARPTHPYTKALLAAVPEPDLDQPLDFDALMAGRASQPDAWPGTFEDTHGTASLVDLGGGHFVRMKAEKAALKEAS